MKPPDKSRRIFLKNSLYASGGLLTYSSLNAEALHYTLANNRPFIGVQLDKPAFENRTFNNLFTEMQDLAAINTIIYFFKDEDVKYSPDHHGNTPFRRGKVNLDKDGKDTIDKMQEAAAPRNIDIYMGGGEMYWGSAFHKFPEVCEVDIYGDKTDFACVNHPEWRKFQMSLHADLFKQHPYLKGFLFMHERRGPMNFLHQWKAWFENTNPRCFCQYCTEKGKQNGLRPEEARAGFQKLVSLFAGEDSLARDGFMVGFFRILRDYPDVLAWEKLMWDSIFDYRKDVIKAIRNVKKEAVIGYHYQHAGLLGDLFWRVGENPEYAKEAADWIKPSVYPGVSGYRLKNVLGRARENYLKDLEPDVSQLVISGWFNRSAENGKEMFGDNPAEQSRFTPEWVKLEVERIAKGASPLPLYAGLGIGIPGSDQVETAEYIAECTKACFKGGANGIILSRHYSEMKPQLVKAAGDVIKNYFNL